MNEAEVVLIHGISIPSIMWKDIATALVAKDCNVLLYGKWRTPRCYPILTEHVDTYGRGYSEAPELPSDTNLYILQLAMLMQYIHWDSADIIGFATVRMITLRIEVTVALIVHAGRCDCRSIHRSISSPRSHEGSTDSAVWNADGRCQLVTPWFSALTPGFFRQRSLRMFTYVY